MQPPKKRRRKTTLDFGTGGMQVFMQSTKIFGATIQAGRVRRIETTKDNGYKCIVEVKGDINLADLIPDEAKGSKST